TRVGIEGSYWATTFPAVLAVSLGMGAAVAPLTTAVLASVETSRTGVASGLNSAVARTGGLIATAVVSAVLAAHGTMLVSAYQIACLFGAGDAVISALCIDRTETRSLAVPRRTTASITWPRRTAGLAVGGKGPVARASQAIDFPLAE